MIPNNINTHFPIVSVIVITYNQQDTIKQSLDSILNQVIDFSYEVIIGDDASSDRTYEICKEYQNKYPEIVRLFRNTENKGILNNYYDCVLRANGKYIADCAGDDFWIDNYKLQKQVNILEKILKFLLYIPDGIIIIRSLIRFRNLTRQGQGRNSLDRFRIRMT